MRAFVSKPVQIVGKQFEGTRESAKEITDWFKSDPKSEYFSATLREQASKYGFGSDTPHEVDTEVVLTLDSGERRQHYLPEGYWLIQYTETGEYSTMTDERLKEIYAEL